LPRPRVNVATVPSTSNRLQVTVSTSGANNVISAIQFTSTPGALIDIPNGQQGASGSFTANPNAPQFQFFIRQQTAGQAATAFFVVTDACGGWQTLAGGGPSAFGGVAPSGPSAPAGAATATATATAGVAVCAPRPAVSVTTAPGAAGQVQVTVTAGGNAALQTLRFGTATNALIDAGDRVGGTGSFTVTLPSGTRQTTFTVRRATAAQATTVNLVAVDSCGEWPTMIGGGAAAF
jgi:hypothetical protein